MVDSNEQSDPFLNIEYLLKEKRSGEALKELLELTTVSELPKYYQLLGDIYLQENKHQEASISYNKGIQVCLLISQECSQKSLAPELSQLRRSFAISEAHISFQNIQVGNVYQVAWGSRSENQLIGIWEPPEFIFRQFPLPSDPSEENPVQEGRRNIMINHARKLTRQDYRKPQKISSLQGHGIIHVSCGDKVSAAISSIGEMYTWGFGSDGALGLLDRVDNSKPTRIENFFSESPVTQEVLEEVFTVPQHADVQKVETTYLLEPSRSKGRVVAEVLKERKSTLVTFDRSLNMNVRVVQVAMGYEHTIALSNTGNLFSCGRNTYGQLGRSAISSCCNPFMVMIKGLESERIISVAVGWFHSLAINSKGQLYAWGRGEKGCLGIRQEVPLNRPQRIPLEATIRQIVAGVDHTMALTSSGEVYSCGGDYYGQLGRTVNRNNHEFQVLSEFEDIGIRQIAAGDNHSLALSIDGTVYSWGHGHDGQLGFGYGNDYSIPSPIKYFTEKNICVRSICAGGDKSVTISINGDLYCFGAGSFVVGEMTIRPLLCRWDLPKGITDIGVGLHHMSILTGKQRNIASDIVSLLSDNTYKDVEFYVEDKRIRAHKVILLCRSPEFKALFADEDKNGRVVVNDVSFDSFSLVIQYCYTENAVISMDNAADILSFATRLKLTVLAQLCENVLGGNAVFSVNSLASGYCDAFEEPLKYYSDVSLVLFGHDDRPIHCHKVILASRCDYFKTMFECSLRESTSNCIQLHSDISYNIFITVLKYIYTGTLDDSVRNADDACRILSLATEYFLIELRQICIEVLLEMLDVDNVIQFIQVAYLYDEETLFNQCVHIIRKPKNYRIFIQSDDFMSLPEEILVEIDPTLSQSYVPPSCISQMTFCLSNFVTAFFS